MADVLRLFEASIQITSSIGLEFRVPDDGDCLFRSGQNPQWSDLRIGVSRILLPGRGPRTVHIERACRSVALVQRRRERKSYTVGRARTHKYATHSRPYRKRPVGHRCGGRKWDAIEFPERAKSLWTFPSAPYARTSRFGIGVKVPR